MFTLMSRAPSHRRKPLHTDLVMSTGMLRRLTNRRFIIIIIIPLAYDSLRLASRLAVISMAAA